MQFKRIIGEGNYKRKIKFRKIFNRKGTGKNIIGIGVFVGCK